MSTDVRRRHVLRAANALFITNGQTTTLEVKEYLRGAGMTVYQSDISYEMQNLSEELEWPWTWEEDSHRVYFIDHDALGNQVNLVELAEEDFIDHDALGNQVNLVELAEEVTDVDPGLHLDPDGEVDLDYAFLTILRDEPDEAHWYLSLKTDDSIEVYVTGVPMDRKYRNPLRKMYKALFGGGYYNTVANHGRV